MPDRDPAELRIDELLAAARKCALTRAGVGELAALLGTNRDVIHVVESALGSADGHAASCLVLASAVNGRLCDAELVGRVLPLMPTEDMLIPLVVATVGDRVGMLADAADARRLPSASVGLALYLAACLQDDREEPRAKLRVAIRTQARRALMPDVGALVGMAARLVGDLHVEEVAREWVDLAERIGDSQLENEMKGKLAKPVIDLLPEEEGPRAVSGFTVRRAAKKVGRNEPCPCGSGRKYKKCCAGKDDERLADPSPIAGVTMAEYKARAHEFMSAAELYSLEPEEILAVGLEKLPTQHLIAALRRLQLAKRWSDAEQALELLDERDDFPNYSTADDYRSELVHAAAGERDRAAHEVAMRQGGLLDELAEFAELRTKLELLNPTAETLAHLDQSAEEGLREPGGHAHIELAYSLLDQYPSLGILVARGVIDPHRGLDSEMLLDEIESVRDRLEMPPGDRALHIYDVLLEDILAVQLSRPQPSQQVDVDASIDEVQELRRQLQDGSRRTGDLERDLAIARRELEDRDAREPDVPASPPSEVDEHELRRLRNKVSELKGLITESHQERKALRKQLGEVSKRIEPVPAEPEDSTQRPSDELDADATPRHARPLVPNVALAVQRALREVPAPTAAAALHLIADLATGTAKPGARIKRVQQARDLWSARVGIHYRLLFRFKGDDGELQVCDLVTRQSHDSAVKRNAG